MPTKNRRAAVYLPPDVDEALSIFKDNQRIDGDSAALIAILREFFELGVTKAHQSPLELESRITSLEKGGSVLQSRVQSLERTVEYLLSELQFSHSVVSKTSSEKVAQTSLGVLNGEPYSELPDDSELQESATQSQLDLDDAVKVEIEVEPMLLTRKALAKRLGLTDSTFGRRKNGHDGMSFEEWSKLVDPDGIAWTFAENLKKYRPLSESP